LLGGFSAEELAFIAGKHLAMYRGEHYIKLLFPSAEELRVINEANTHQVFFGPLTEPGFWNDSADERRAAFRYLEGLIDEARRFRRREERR
jgi:hypothetical protein